MPEGHTRLDDLRATMRVRMQSLVNALRELEQEQKVERINGVWRLARPSKTVENQALNQDANLPGETEAGPAEAPPAEG